VRKTSGQIVAGIAAAARPSIAAGSTARLTGALAVTLGVAAACWVIAIQRMSGMDMGVSTRLGSFGLFTVLWLVMMAAMMLPGAAPEAVRRAQASGRLLAAPLFAGSYLGVWALADVVVYALYQPHGTVAAGAAAIVAGMTSSRRSSSASAAAAATVPAPDSSSGCAAPDRASG
jgi:predicted metal-binding membrane protein